MTPVAGEFLLCIFQATYLLDYVLSIFRSNSVEKIHSVGTINNVETSYVTQLKMCYLMTTFRCQSDILITS